jgi:large subunit ribosomal protein L17
MPGTRKLGKTTDQRKAMLRQQVTDLLDMGRMETTVFRAKEIAPLAEKMITLGKKKDMTAYRQALAFITREDVAKKVFDEVAPKYADRNGGYPHHPHRHPPWRCGRDGCHRARVRSFRTPIIMHRPFCGRCIFFGCKKPRRVCSRCVFVFYRPVLSVV